MKEAHREAYQKCVPWFVNIELTLSCNLSCQHCYNFDRNQPMPESFKKNLNPEQIFKLIEDLKKAGTLMISFTGGEALLNANLFDYIKKARSENLLVKIKSNGTLITPSIAKKLKDFEVYNVDISLYGSNSEEHDFLTQVSGSYKNTINGIQNLINNNIPVEINYTLHKKNFKSIENMISIAEKLNCHFNFNTELTEKYDLSRFNEELRLDQEDFIYLLKSSAKDFFIVDNSNKALQCECARTVCAINSSGDVLPCIGAPIKSGNILEKSFEDIWKNSNQLNTIRNLQFEDFQECSKCEMIEKCARSSGSAFVNTGNYKGKNPINCLEADARIKSGL